jgi:DICT domain-containing protein
LNPNYTIDPSLSVYGLVRRTREERLMLTSRRTMSFISYEIENAIIQTDMRARVFAGFQRMSRFLPQVQRYRMLAQHAEAIYVFGVMDVQPPPMANVRYIPLRPTDQLAKEWFLVAEARDYYSLLATEELTSPDDPDYKRRFQGIWSYDEELSTIIQEWLTSMVGARPLPSIDEQRNYRRQVQYMNATIGHLVMRLAQVEEMLRSGGS